MGKNISRRIAESRRKGLYRAGGVAAIIAAVLLLAEISVFSVWPQPDTADGYFVLFQNNRLIGLIDFYLLEFFAYILFIPVFLAIYVAIKRVNEGYMALALVIVLTGVAVFIATNNPFSMLLLSNQYTAATTDAQKNLYLAAGQIIITNTGQRAFGGFNTGFFLVAIAGLIISVIMLRSETFSKKIACVGILTFTISLLDYARVVFLPSATVLLIIIAAASGLLLMIWLVMIAIRLLQPGREV
jgi:hypothetical protein